jgi:hypothetical protein
MIAQGAMAFNSLRLPHADPYGVPQILVALKSLHYGEVGAEKGIIENSRQQGNSPPVREDNVLLPLLPAAVRPG